MKVVLDNLGRTLGVIADDLAPGIRVAAHRDPAPRGGRDPMDDPALKAAVRMLELDLRDTASGRMPEAAFWAKHGTEHRALLTKYLWIHRLWVGAVTEEEFNERYPALGAAAMLDIRR